MRELQLLVRHGQGYSAIRESSGAAIYSLHPIESSLQSLAWRFCAKVSLLSNDSDQKGISSPRDVTATTTSTVGKALCSSSVACR